MHFKDIIEKRLASWLLRDSPPRRFPLSDFNRLSYEIRPCDVILIEGRSRVSEVIRIVTQSAWTHAALYIGRLHDVENPVMRARIQDFYKASPEEQLILESMLGQGTIITPLSVYKQDHLRICRPKGIERNDAQRVISYSIGKLGTDYDVRQFFDLARLLFPWHILPRRWLSSLFTQNTGKTLKTVCSTMLAEAFQSVDFPILPVMGFDKDDQNITQLYKRNPRLYTPRDFDYSPHFEIIKYPFISFGVGGSYKNLPWSEDETLYDDDFS